MRKRQKVQIESKIWFQLYDFATGQPYMESSASKVSLPTGSDVDDFRDAVKAKYSDSDLQGVSPSKLVVYRNIEAFNNRNSENVSLIVIL